LAVDDDLAATGSTVNVARLVTSTVKITVLVRIQVEVSTECRYAVSIDNVKWAI